MLRAVKFLVLSWMISRLNQVNCWYWQLSLLPDTSEGNCSTTSSLTQCRLEIMMMETINIIITESWDWPNIQILPQILKINFNLVLVSSLILQQNPMLTWWRVWTITECLLLDNNKLYCPRGERSRRTSVQLRASCSSGVNKLKNSKDELFQSLNETSRIILIKRNDWIVVNVATTIQVCMLRWVKWRNIWWEVNTTMVE